MVEEKIDTWMFKEKGENINLFFSILLTSVVGYFFINVSLGLTIGVAVIAIIYIKLQQAQLLGNALEITDIQFPEIHKVFSEHKKKLGIKQARLFVIQDPNPNGFTIGFPKASIVLTSSLVEGLSLDELSFVIGHELGHVKAKHNFVLTFISPLGSNIPAATYLFSFWQRKAEYSCDKCSLILNKKIEPAIDTLMKISIGMNLIKKINPVAYKEQLINSDNSTTKTSELLFDHPLTTNRVKKMVAFWRNNFIIN